MLDLERQISEVFHVDFRAELTRVNLWFEGQTVKQRAKVSRFWRAPVGVDTFKWLF